MGFFASLLLYVWLVMYGCVNAGNPSAELRFDFVAAAAGLMQAFDGDGDGRSPERTHPS